MRGGLAGTLLPHPVYGFGAPSLVVDLSAWGLDDRALRAVAAHAPYTRVLRASPWQGALFSAKMLGSLAQVGHLALASRSRAPRVFGRHLTMPPLSPSLPFFARQAMVGLRHLHLPGCDAWGDLGACRALAASDMCPRLISLDLSLSAVADAGLSAIARRSHALEALYASSCPRLTEASVLLVGRHCRQLRCVDLSWNLNLSSEGVAAVLAECSELQCLSLRGLGRGYVAVPLSGADAASHVAAAAAAVLASAAASDGKSGAKTGGGLSAAGDADAGVGAGADGGVALSALAGGAAGDGEEEATELQAQPVSAGLAGRPFMLHRIMGARAELLMHVREVRSPCLLSTSAPRACPRRSQPNGDLPRPPSLSNPPAPPSRRSTWKRAWAYRTRSSSRWCATARAAWSAFA